MSNYVRDAKLTVNEKMIWRPARGSDHAYDYAVQFSPSARARCRKCSQFVKKGELRIAIPIKHPGGDHGWISAWQHLGCTRVEERSDFENIMFGYTSLKEEEQKKVIDEITSETIPGHLQPLDPDDLVKRGKLEEMQPPNTLLRPLLPYQKEALGWMIQQEKSELKGGILADEMGMGKTIQMISLMLAHRVTGPTLVVCPVSSMLQWEAEINEHVVPGALSVVVVYRTTHVKREQLENADVVLTTYPMIEQAWRALVNKIKVPCPYCEQLFIPRQLVVHNKYFCGPRAKKTQRQMKRKKNEKSEGVRNNKVQSEATIKKGLRTLHVDVDNVEEDNDASSPKEEDSKDDGDATTAAHDDEDDAGGADTTKRFMGPIGMYQELMREAGRTVRGRWDTAAANVSGSSSSSSNEDSNDDDDDSSSTVSGDDDTAAGLQSSKEQEFLDSFCCKACGFQMLRFPFCPKTGQHHVITEELKSVVETDTGGDDVDLDASIFHAIPWARIVLDEAHRIKGRTTSTARSAFALRAEHRWCLTGTPLQNRVGDLYSLLRFIRLSPYARYYCSTEGCSCSSLSHPFSGTSLRQCVFCGHGPIQHYAHFNRYVLNPITRYGYIGEGRQGMILLSNDVFSKAMLRRTKAERAADLHLPPMSTSVRKITLTKEERNFYESLYKRSTSEFDTFVNKGTILHNYAHIFQLLSRLRQALDHPLLVVKGMNAGEVVHADGVCGICGDGLVGESIIKVTPCKHSFHRLCLRQFLESAPGQEYQCPTCFVRISVDLRQLVDVDADEDAGAAAMPPELEDELDDDNDEDEEQQRVRDDDEDAIQWHSESGPNEDDADDASPGAKRSRKKTNNSKKKKIVKSEKEKRGILARVDPSKPLHGTKLDAVADYIESIPDGEKVIVFSQFGDMLDLTQYWLQRRFIKSVKLCGSLTLAQRQSVLQAFLHDAKVQVILISLKAGGEGLNLQVANHVVLLDPWWNPAVEMQAVQRAHRIGQTRPVHAVRFVTENSVEERMVELQDKKLLVFEGTVDGKFQALNKLSEEDLQFLFTR